MWLDSETVWSYTRMTRAKRMIRSRAPLNVLVVLFFLSILRFLALRLKQDLVPDQAVDDPRSKNPLNEH